MGTIKSFSPRISLVLGLCIAGYAHSLAAQTAEAYNPPGTMVVETGVLQNVVGFKGNIIGAEVVAISPGAEDTQVIDIVIPVNPDAVDQVRVFDPDGKPLKHKRAMEIIFDHENGELGVVLTLPKKEKLGFKFKLIDIPDDQQ